MENFSGKFYSHFLYVMGKRRFPLKVTAHDNDPLLNIRYRFLTGLACYQSLKLPVTLNPTAW